MKQIFYCFLFPIIATFMFWDSVITFFKRDIKWEKVAHIENRSIDDMKEIEEDVLK